MKAALELMKRGASKLLCRPPHRMWGLMMRRTRCPGKGCSGSVTPSSSVFRGVRSVGGAAPLGSGAIATGKVEVVNQRTVQHLEGGIIEDIRITDGSEVARGDLLLLLDDTRARSQFVRLEQQFLAARAQEARLKAEREGTATIAFPRGLIRRQANPEIADILDGQRRLLDNRRRSIDSQIGLLDRRIAKSREEITALDAQQRADRRQLELISEEIDGVRDLVDKGLERKPRLLSLQRNEAELLGSIDNRTALKARAEQTIAETEFRASVCWSKRQARSKPSYAKRRSRSRICASRSAPPVTRWIAPRLARRSPAASTVSVFIRSEA